jgi:hypothetical protein
MSSYDLIVLGFRPVGAIVALRTPQLGQNP